MYIVSVMLLSQSLPNGVTLPYRSTLQISPGCVVSVPFRNYFVLALVVACHSVRDSKSTLKSIDFQIKPLTEVIGEHVFFSRRYLAELTSAANLTAPLCSVPLMPEHYLAQIISTLGSTIDHGVIVKAPELPNMARGRVLLRRYGTMTELYSILDRLIARHFGGEFAGLMTLVCPDALTARRLAKVVNKYEPSVITSADQFRKLQPKLPHARLVISTCAYITLFPQITTCIIFDPLSHHYQTVTKPHIFRSLLLPLLSASSSSDTILLGPTLPWYFEYRALGFARKAPNVLVLPESAAESSTPIALPSNDAVLARALRGITHIVGVRTSGLYALLVRSTVAAKLLRCRSCGDIPRCPTCESPFSLSGARMLECGRCKTSILPYDICDNCQGHYEPWSPGTKAFVEMLSGAFPNAHIIEVTKDALGDNVHRARSYSQAKTQSEHSVVFLVGSISLAYLIDEAVAGVLCTDGAFLNPASAFAIEDFVHLLERICCHTLSPVYIYGSALERYFGNYGKETGLFDRVFLAEMQTREQFGLGTLVAPECHLSNSFPADIVAL